MSAAHNKKAQPRTSLQYLKNNFFIVMIIL